MGQGVKIMIKFYSGTPGSGKSYHTATEILYTLRSKKNCITTVEINMDYVSGNGKRKTGIYKFIPILDLDVKDLYTFAIQNHRKGKEGQTLIVIDECQIIFDSRGFQKKDRAEWILFFSRHRHLGYDIILISQQDRMIDRQIRGMFEYEYRHRKVNNYGWMWLIPFTYFVVVQYWYGTRSLRISSQFIRYRKKVAKIYDSYTMFDDYIGLKQEQQNPVAADAESVEISEVTKSQNTDQSEILTQSKNKALAVSAETKAEMGVGGPHRSFRLSRNERKPKVSLKDRFLHPILTANVK